MLCHTALAQGLVMGSSTTMSIGTNSTLHIGPAASFTGTLDNQGEIIGRSTLDFQSNTETGALQFQGNGQQELTGDSLIIEKMTLAEGASLSLNTQWAVVTDSLSLISGSITAGDANGFLIGSETIVAGDGFVAGPVLAVVGEDPVTFPMGINGAKNHLQISSATRGTILRVTCQVPADTLLTPGEDMIGIASQVQWGISAVGRSLSSGRVALGESGQAIWDEGIISVDFSGVNLQSFAQSNVIRANDYEPALVYYSDADSAYRIVTSGDIYDTDEVSFGKIRTSARMSFSSEPLLLGLAQVPVLTAPTFFVPSAFAPQGMYDENHRFRPYFAGSEINSVSFSVWDSFNEEVHSFRWQGEDIDLTQTGWDGRLSTGLEAPAGVYYFSVDLGTETGRYTKNGSVMLVK